MDIYFILFIAIVIYIISPSLLGTATLLTFIIYVISSPDLSPFLPKEQVKLPNIVPEERFSSEGPYKGAVDDDLTELAITNDKFYRQTADDRIVDELKCRNDPNIRYTPNKKFSNALYEELNEQEVKPWFSRDEY